jgi:general stress protein YciG
MDTNAHATKKMRGFAALTPERRSEISRKGGVIAHQRGSAHEWDSSAAREAGRKGGLASRARRAMTSTQPMSSATMSARPANDQIGIAAKREAN